MDHLPDQPANGPLPPPAPSVAEAPQPHAAPRGARIGELTTSWRVALGLSWALAFVAYMGVWKASEELGIATWWLGPRSNPQPIVVRLIPFVVCAVFGSLAGMPIRRLPWVGLAGAAVMAAIALPDFSRIAGLATVELIIACALATVSLASLTGRYRAPVPDATAR